MPNRDIVHPHSTSPTVYSPVSKQPANALIIQETTPADLLKLNHAKITMYYLECVCTRRRDRLYWNGNNDGGTCEWVRMSRHKVLNKNLAQFFENE